MEIMEMKEWLIKIKSELKKIELPSNSVHYGIIQGSLLMIELMLEKMS